MRTKTDDQERVAFEAWASGPTRADKLPLDRWPTNGAYKDTRTYLTHFAWQARAAVEADRQDRMPSDAELKAWGQEEEFFLFCDPDEFLDIVKSALARYGSSQPAASAETSVVLKALADLVDVLRKRHYGRMPDEVREAYERAWAIVFSSPAKLPSAPVAHEPPQVTDAEIEQIVTGAGARWDGSVWKVEDADLHPMARALLYRYTTAPVAAPVAREPVGSDIEQMAITRYRPVSDGLLRYKVVAGDGTRALFHGTKDECRIVARKLTEAFLDGAFVARSAAPVAAQPIDMVLHCPACGAQHVDAPEATQLDKEAAHAVGAPEAPWTNPPHRSHLCANCGHIWRPADVATNGVAAIKTKGRHDSAPVATQAQLQNGQQNIHKIIPEQPTAQDDETLADTQRQIIEAAEQRGYARAKSECGRDHENAKRYTWLRDHPPKDCQGGMRVRIWGESGDWTSISGEKLDAAIDAARAAKEADHG